MGGSLGALIGSYAADIGAYNSISTVTVGAGGTSSISFTSIPSTYKHLQIRGMTFSTSVSNLRGSFNGDTGPNYFSHWLGGNGASAQSGSGGLAIYLGFMSSTAQPSSFVMDILDYANTSKNTTLRNLFGQDVNGSGWSMFTSSAWNNTNAVTSIAITPETGNFAQNSRFALYGIKG
jgi:hypothetical protein